MKSDKRRVFLKYSKNVIGTILLFRVWPISIFLTKAENLFALDQQDPIRILVVYASHHGSTAQIAVFMGRLFPDLTPSHIGAFAGMLDYDKCNFITKLVMWSIMRKNGLKAGDYRDWKAIEAWLGVIKKDLISANKYTNA